MDLKSLKKLADMCRKAGIKTYRDSEVEFTLSEDRYMVVPRRSRSKKTETVETANSTEAPEFTSDSLTEEQLIAWSSGEVNN